ncbi:hypothetical protein KY361_00935 [Candidatus Woesearchaeota archaeon]|nr:hypothetical protein [Candidatus Woesearchaeota archaeon]
MEEVKAGSPVFVKIDEYKDVLEIIGVVKDKIEEARNTLGRINELKNDEDGELEMWNSKLEEIEEKIEFIDKSLFQPETL